ncbi:alpha/beta hydrolase [Planotetraspora sp. A-T 1434]|uniref:alpha/beta hydrolase n=1 Tax=Planotetraspora sp. A-T 1434 TaxID=2979219 RepID=UPI0021C19DA8|nr:alpha/beta hydrolase [Planotetraspora sp. A-T 1434]MCT9932540.1 alpha/beta hydrolase [Planotetraspora sp. A-T 1434]
MRTRVGTAVGAGALALAAVLLAPAHAGASAVANATVETKAGARAGTRAEPTPTVTPTPSTSPSAGPTPTPTPTTSAPSDIKIRTFSYGPHVRQRMDVWWHTTGARRPAVFVIHGGWWSGGDKKYMTEVSRSYAQLGYTVVNLDYRLSGDAAWPAQRTDAIDGIATVRRHAALFNTDPDRYVVVGFSAGGHIAAAIGTYGDGLPGLRGVVGVSPVISPLTAYTDGDEGGDAEQRKLRRAAIVLAGGCQPAECPKTWSSMEVPFHATAGDAPVLTVHSTDEFVPPYQSEMLRQALGAVGVPMTIKTMPGTEHSAPLYREPGVAETVQAWIAARLAR